MIGPRLQVSFPPSREMVREDVWLRAWVAVASSFNAKEPDCVRYADACLKAFDKRFPDPSAAYRKAIADTHPKDGDAKQAPLGSGGGAEGNRT